MLIDKIKEWEQEMPEGLHEQLGGCKFCGQAKMLHLAAPWDEERCNEAVTEMCDCIEAREYTRKKSRKEKVISSIEENFGEKANLPIPAAATIMMAAVEFIVAHDVDNVTIKVGKVKCKLSMTAKDTVKVERTITKNDSVEV